MAGAEEGPLPDDKPETLTETSVLVPLTMSCTYTSGQPLVSMLTMPSACVVNATYWPLELMPRALKSLKLGGVAEGKVGDGVETISVVLETKSRRKASFLFAPKSIYCRMFRN